MELYYLGNSRLEEQRAEMIRLEEAGVCLFCPEHRPRDQVPLLRTDHWSVVPNRYPYQGTRVHLMLVPDEHVTDMADLSGAAQADFWPTLRWTRDRHGLTHYGIGVRNGESRFTGGTIKHLHVHVLTGDVDDPDHTPVRMKFSSRPRED
ncbi:HIT family protein [Actinokineospora sp. PR83]|uniref:HIT family protein n=1 Tax=Actinokineospora sp. PR83 TaxID=2884908 RepID=UPI0027E0C2D8|nr:HIT family protein [Actinokineospora sp. PR83]MCG8918128.1 HIT family protein [Actinokineospora sp. PR83]